MNKVFIIADLNLFNEELANDLGFADFEIMNDHIIRSWNQTVKPDDDVIVMGDIGNATVEQLSSVITKLNGTLLLTSKTAKEQFTKDEWKQIGFTHIWSVPLFKTFDNGDEIYYPIQPIKAMSVYENQYKVLVVDHNNPVEGMTKGIMLSADAAKWDWCPLDTDGIIELHKNMQEFEQMENGEEHRSDVKEEE